MQCDFRNRNAYFYGSPKGLPTVNGQVRQDEDDHRQVVHERHLYQRPFASRFHAELKQEGDQVLLVDACNANGTVVNGKRVTAPVPLWPGDLIRIGETEIEHTSEEQDTLSLPPI
jgi:pSer/pThr/pTyr-binding forkhead associated (FHA) protein